MALEDEVRAQTASIDKLITVLGGQGRSGTTGTTNSSAGGAGVDFLNRLNAGTNNTVASLGKFSQGLYTVGDAMGDFNKVAGLLGPVGSAFSKIGTDVLAAAFAVNKSLNSVSQSGIYLGNNLGLYEEAVLGARMSLPEFEKFVKSNSRALAGLGAGMDQSALIFLNMSKELQENQIAYDLKATGVQTEEFGRVLSIVSHNARQDDLTNDTARKRLVASTLSLTVEMDNIARLTGIQRQEQQEALEKQLNAKETQLMMAAMDADQAEALTENLTQTKQYGSAVQEAVKIMATGGVTNAARQSVMVSIGPDMENAVMRLNEIRGTTPEDLAKRNAIKQEMDNIALRDSKDKENLKQMSVLITGGNTQTEAIASAYLERIRYGQILAKAEIEANRGGLTREAYIADQVKKFGIDRVAAGKGEKGTEGEASLLATTLNRTETLFKDLTAAAGVGFNKLNVETGGVITGFDKLNTVLTRFKAADLVNMVEQFKANIKSELGPIAQPVTPPDNARRGGRAEGSLGATGKLIEDFGTVTPMDLHGKEGVITEKQLNNLVGNVIGNTQNKNVELTSNQITSMFKSIQGFGDKPEMDAKQVTQMFSDLPMFKGNKEAEDGIKHITSIIDKLPGAIDSKTGSIDPKQLGSMFDSMQSSLKSELEKTKASMPTTSTFEKMFSQFKMPEPAPAPTAQPIKTSTSKETDAMTDLSKGIEQLNMRMERLITAVVDGSDKSVRAIKSGANLV